jgi:hypothetical protein
MNRTAHVAATYALAGGIAAFGKGETMTQQITQEQELHLFEIWSDQVRRGARSSIKGKPLSDAEAIALACREVGIPNTKTVREMYATWASDAWWSGGPHFDPNLQA